MALSEKAMVSVVMPVYNEKAFIEEAVRRAVQTGIPAEIVIVDDFSTDGTRDVIERMRVGWEEHSCSLKVLLKGKNEGKGSALRAGFGAATGNVVIIQDADLEYDPRDYPKLLAPILDGKADVVYGSRFLGDPHRVLFFWHMVGNKALTFFSNMLTNINLSDMETGYKAFRTEVIRNIRLTSDRFGFEPEFTAKVAKAGYRIYETSISYSGRTYEEGKKVSWRDGVAAFYHIIRYNLFS